MSDQPHLVNVGGTTLDMSGEFPEIEPTDTSGSSATTSGDLGKDFEETPKHEPGSVSREAEDSPAVSAAGLSPVERAAIKFVARHQDDYTPTPRNSALLLQYCEANDLPLNETSLEMAFHQLQFALEKPAPSGPPLSRAGRQQRQASAPGLLSQDELEAIREKTASMSLLQARDYIQRRMREAHQRTNPDDFKARQRARRIAEGRPQG